MNELNRDYLTGLYNRQELHKFYHGLVMGERFHIMFLDVDNFKAVNDLYGHNEGDVVLKYIAFILKSSAPEACIIRLGGDEFCLLFVGEHTREKLEVIAKQIIERITQKEGFVHITTFISASIGILFNETKRSTLDEILQKSDMAMYYAKSHGKGNYIVFNDIENDIVNELEMEKRQKMALENGEFEIRYLPVINAQTSKLRLSRVVLHWNMPDGTTKEQKEFLPLFKKNGFIRDLVLWVLPQILSHLKAYHERTGLAGKIGVRISRLVLLDKMFPEYLLQLVAEYGVKPEEIELEMDESSFAHMEVGILDALKCLKDKGFSVSVAGVGSDFKSIIYWDKFQFDSITFDAAYLRNTLSNPRGRQVIKILLALGRELKMAVIADGIETKEEASFLSRCGCNAICGPVCSMPISLLKYQDYVSDKIVQGENAICFPFMGNLCSKEGGYEGIVHGENIEYAKGISDNWGSLLFKGGPIQENVVELPQSILGESSYTICMWIKPHNLSSWTSAFYARYRGSFCSFSPFVIGGNSVFRVSEDAEFSGFHDAFTRHIPSEIWSCVCLTYDEYAGIIRTYINGRKACYAADIPVLAACRQILLGGDPFQLSFEGYISGVIFYDYAKSEEEIQDIYKGFCEEPGFEGKMENFWLE